MRNIIVFSFQKFQFIFELLFQQRVFSFQDTYETFFFIVDLHAVLFKFADNYLVYIISLQFSHAILHFMEDIYELALSS